MLTIHIFCRLLKIADNHKLSIADQVKGLSQRQQTVALKHAQEEIVRTQCAYKQTSKKMLKLIDQNKVLQGRNHDMEVQVSIQQSLISAARNMSQTFKSEKSLKTVCIIFCENNAI